MHRITDNRVGGLARKNIRMFEKLCGEKKLKNVVIVTTRWEKMQGEGEEAKARAREKNLCEGPTLFKRAIEEGATVTRHDNTPAKALEILEEVVKRRPVPMRIQEEMVDEGKDLDHTDAGVEVVRLLRARVRALGEELQIMREEVEKMRNSKLEDREELETTISDLRAQGEKLVEGYKRMAVEYEAEKKKWEGWRREEENRGFFGHLYRAFVGLVR